MKKDAKIHRYLRAIHHWIVFFMIAAFFITCCNMLFVTLMSNSMGIDFTNEHLADAAKLTFINVVFLSALFAAFDGVRRYLFVHRPVKKIISGTEKLMQGDFSVRIPTVHGASAEDSFNQIIECFNKMAEELSGTETLRTDFIANVSHELKTPLAIMQNYATMLQAPGLSEQERLEYAKAISEASRRLANLITNILKLNKLENQQIYPTFENYDLSEQICECLLGFEDIWEKKQIEIETDIEDGVCIRSDAEMMSLVWNNLFSNAFKFTSEGGTVSVSVKSENDRAVVKVSDTGCGISTDVGAHMFDKFYQGDTSHASQGNGLGLALVKRVVDITGSDISVKSELGKGSTFTVTLKRGHDHELEKDRA